MDLFRYIIAHKTYQNCRRNPLLYPSLPQRLQRRRSNSGLAKGPKRPTHRRPAAFRRWVRIAGHVFDAQGRLAGEILLKMRLTWRSMGCKNRARQSSRL